MTINAYLCNQEASTLHMVVGGGDMQSAEFPLHQVVDVAGVPLQNLLHCTEEKQVHAEWVSCTACYQ